MFITGGGSGIGAALTDGFMQQGAKVSFVQRSSASEFVASLHQRYGYAPLFLTCDLTDVRAIQRGIAEAQASQGEIDVLINNAGNDERHILADFSSTDWDDNLAVNLRPCFFTAQAVAPSMRQRGEGSIVNVSSASYLMGNAGYPAYVASKAAITGLSRALARELGADGIRVNTLVPGWVMTEKQKRLWASQEDLVQHLGKQCLKRHLMVEDLVPAALFLSSSASNMMTGQALVIDGGVVVSG